MSLKLLNCVLVELGGGDLFMKIVVRKIEPVKSTTPHEDC